MTSAPARFRTLRLLGEGGMGEVHLAEDLELGRTVALKVLSSELARTPTVRARFEREARVQARLAHPHVVAIWDCCLGEEPPFLVMEAIDGEDLGSVLAREGRLPLARVVRIAREVASGLDAMHDAGVLHRDIKPSNVMLRSPDGAAVVMDLGLARAEDERTLTATGQILGTPAYLPPEILRDAPWTVAGDVYQLGALAFECLAGTSMVEDGEVGEILARVGRREFAALPPELDLPARVSHALARAAAADPAVRFAAPGDLAAALGEEDAGPPPGGTRPLPVTPAPLEDRAAPAPRPSRAPLFAGVGALALVAGLAGLGGAGAPPEDVRMRVVGDALVAEFRGPGAGAVRLEVGDRVETELPREGEDGWVLVHRGLPPDSPIRARLTWPGGAGPWASFRGLPSAVRAPGHLGPRGGLGLEVTRPCRVSWEGAPGPGWELAPGEREIPLPPGPPARSTLAVVEEGIASRLALDLRDLERATAERLRARLAPLDLAALRGRPGPEVAEARGMLDASRALFAPVAPLLPRLLQADLPRDLRAWLLARWSLEQWGQALQAVIPDLPGPTRLAAGEVGSRRAALPPWPGAVTRTLELRPVGGRDHDPEGRSYQLRTHHGSIPFGGPYARAADALATRWPADVPAAGPVAVSIHVGAFQPACLLELRTGDGAWSLELWGPVVGPGKRPRHEAWLSAVLPGDLTPEPGADLGLRLATMFGPAARLGYVEEVRVSWPAGGGSGDLSRPGSAVPAVEP